jgi:hypothetical protein
MEASLFTWPGIGWSLPTPILLFDARSTAARHITTRFPTSLRVTKAWLVRDSIGGAGIVPTSRAGKGDKARRHDDDMATAAPEAGAAADNRNGLAGDDGRRTDRA